MDPWKNIAELSPSEIHDLQSRKFHHFLTIHLYPFSPFYRRVFDERKIDPRRIRDVKDLEHIPFISKKDFIDPGNPQKFREFILQPEKDTIRKYWPLPKLLELKLTSLLRGEEYLQDKLEREYRPSFITYTTGTTSFPVPFAYTGHDIANLNLSGARMLKVFGITRSENIVNMFPYAPHLAFWQVVFAGFSSCVLILSTGGGKVMGTEGNIAVLEKMKPVVILGIPSYVYHVLRTAQAKGCRLPSIKKVVLGAARVSVSFKLRLAEMLSSMGATDVSVFGTYGFTEARAAWAECPTANDVSSGYHLYPDKEIFEIIDPDTGQVKGEGEDGEIVYTSLDSRGSSVLRFRTGDYAKGGITNEPCPHCRRRVPRLSSDITRLSDVKDLHLTKVKGALVNFSNLAEIFSEFREIEEWQVEIRKKDDDPFEIDELVVYITPRGDIRQSALTDAVSRRMAAVTEITPNAVVYIPLAEMIRRLELETSNKERRFLDRRPKV